MTNILGVFYISPDAVLDAIGIVVWCDYIDYGNERMLQSDPDEHSRSSYDLGSSLKTSLKIFLLLYRFTSLSLSLSR